MSIDASIIPDSMVRSSGRSHARELDQFFASNNLNQENVGFGEILDAVNPINHIPGISASYQSDTGATLGKVAGLAASAVLGGPIGLLTGLLGTAYEAIAGETMVGSVFAMFSGDSETELAANAYSKAAALSG